MPGVGRVRRGFVGGGVVRGNGVHADCANDAKHTEYAWHTHCAKQPEHAQHTNGAEYPEYTSDYPWHAAQHASGDLADVEHAGFRARSADF
jgi:hypothetical protein